MAVSLKIVIYFHSSPGGAIVRRWIIEQDLKPFLLKREYLLENCPVDRGKTRRCESKNPVLT